MTRLQKLSIATTASTLLLVAVGGLVRATDSGLGCPGWPTCFGRWIPPFEYHAIIEYSHRLLASVVVVLTGLLTYVAWKDYRRVKQITRPATLAAVLVLLQAGLGGIVVEGGLHATLVTLHFATAMALLGVLSHITASSFCTVKLPTKGPSIAGSDPSFARLTVITAAATGLLLVAGGSSRPSAGRRRGCSSTASSRRSCSSS
jgi:heme A synthase